MVHYPQKFHSEAVATPGIKGTWETSASDHQIKCSIPREYEGSGEAFSPEEFFLISLQNCFIASFKVYADHLKLEYEKVEVSADLMVTIEHQKGPVMKSVEMNIQLYGVENESKAKRLIDKALTDGFIFNSINTSVKSNINFLT